MSIHTRLGAHVLMGSRNGYGELVQAGLAVVLALDVDGAFDEPITQRPDTIRVYRTQQFWKDAPQGIDQWTPAQAEAQAIAWYPVLRDDWLAHKPAHAYQVINEPGGNDINVIPSYIAFERMLGILAANDGWQLVVANLAGGTPGNLDIWQEYWLPHIIEMASYGHYYGRHAYGGLLVQYEPDGTIIPYDGNTARPFDEADILLAQAPNVQLIITELGFYGGWDQPAPDLMLQQLLDYDKLMRTYSNIKAAATYTLGSWATANWDHISLPLAEEITKINEEYTPPGPPTQYKKVFHLLPQSTTPEEFYHAISEGDVLANRNTLMFSLDDATELASLPTTRQDSIVYAWWFNRWTPEERQRLIDTGINVILREWAGVDPLHDLQLGPLFRVNHVLTSPFNAPRSYGLHEGIDLDILTGDPDSNEPIICPYPALVSKVRYATGDYYNFVVLDHLHNGEPFQTWYAHLDAIYVSEGQSLKVGDEIGELGGTGAATAEHLHWNFVRPGKGLQGYVVDDVVDPEPFWNPIVNPPPQPVPNKIDLLPYIRGDGRAYYVKAIINGNEHGEVMWTESNLNEFFQVKNTQWEQFFYDAVFIYRDVDTSPGGGRYYRLTDQDLTQTSRWIHRHLAVGESTQRNPYVQFYHKDDCSPSAPNSGQAASTITLVGHYDTMTFFTGYVLNDVIELSWQGLETYYYARNYGLVGWHSHTGNKSAIEHENATPQQREIINCL